MMRLTPQPYDWAQVLLPRRRKAKCPNLSETTEEHVNKDLDKHFEEKYRGDNIPKTRTQKQMTSEQRQETIDKMLDRAGFRLGIAPLTAEHIQRVDRILASKSLFSPDDSPAMKKKTESCHKKLDDKKSQDDHKGMGHNTDRRYFSNR